MRLERRFLSRRERLRCLKSVIQTLLQIHIEIYDHETKETSIEIFGFRDKIEVILSDLDTLACGYVWIEA